tara:strand:- start:429 stop:923 length:495 start_codon:yes stop_codon:yes gene_type:complete
MALQQTTTRTGQVKWFNGRRGYGFITDLESNNDIFVHHSGLTVSQECWKALYLGEYVEYSLTEGDDGKSQALNVTGVRGGSLMCEELAVNQQQQQERDGAGDGSYQRRRGPFPGRGRGRGRRFGRGGGRGGGGGSVGSSARVSAGDGAVGAGSGSGSGAVNTVE